LGLGEPCSMAIEGIDAPDGHHIGTHSCELKSTLTFDLVDVDSIRCMMTDTNDLQAKSCMFIDLHIRLLTKMMYLIELSTQPQTLSRGKLLEVLQTIRSVVNKRLVHHGYLLTDEEELSCRHRICNKKRLSNRE